MFLPLFCHLILNDVMTCDAAFCRNSLTTCFVVLAGFNRSGVSRIRKYTSCRFLYIIVRPMSHTRFYRAILSRNFIARQSCGMQLCMSHTATSSHKQELTNQLDHFLFMRQSCSVRHAQL